MFDHGSDASVTTKNCYEKLKLVPQPTNRALNISTMTGKTSTTSQTVEIKLTKEVSIKTFALDTNIKLDKQKIDVRKLWPSLDGQLAKEVKRNITSRYIDVIVGMDQLY